MDDIFEPRFYKAWNEALIKEKKIRLKWHEAYGPKLDDPEEAQKADAGEDQELPCTCKDKGKWQKLPEKKFDWPRNVATGTCTLTRIAETSSEMKAPPPLIKSKLYEGISHEGKGRAGYLKRRWKEDPEDKFLSRVCTNWNYGWNYGKENELSCNDPDHCEIREIVFP